MGKNTDKDMLNLNNPLDVSHVPFLIMELKYWFQPKYYDNSRGETWTIIVYSSYSTVHSQTH